MANDKVIDGSSIDPIPAIILSADPNKAMQEMMDIIDTLKSVYEEENSALVSADTKRFMDLQERKINAAQRYHDSAAQMIEKREQIMTADPALRQKLQQSHNEFSSIAQQNISGIQRMDKAVKRLSERIIKSARETALRESANYRQNGRMYGQNRPVSMGINESA